jgi:hypothetical protein
MGYLKVILKICIKIIFGAKLDYFLSKWILRDYLGGHLRMIHNGRGRG